MRTEYYPQIKAIQETTAEAFQDKFNSVVKELSGIKILDQTITITGETFSAVITYQHVEHIKDSVADDFHEAGIHYQCRDCPYLDDPRDRRTKHCTCKYAELGMTHKDSEACEKFYQDVKAGLIVPIDGRLR